MGGSLGTSPLFSPPRSRGRPGLSPGGPGTPPSPFNLCPERAAVMGGGWRHRGGGYRVLPQRLGIPRGPASLHASVSPPQPGFLAWLALSCPRPPPLWQQSEGKSLLSDHAGGSETKGGHGALRRAQGWGLGAPSSSLSPQGTAVGGTELLGDSVTVPVWGRGGPGTAAWWSGKGDPIPWVPAVGGRGMGCGSEPPRAGSGVIPVGR